MRRVLPVVFLALGLLFGLACGGGDGASSVTVHVIAATGGVVALDDGTRLVIPPAALSADTDVTLSRPGAQALSSGALLGAVELGPDGLELMAPATLTLPFSADEVPDDVDLTLEVMSGLNPLARSSGEVNPIAEVVGATRQGAAFEASISHFSWYAILVHKKAYLAVELPGELLEDGDILYALIDAVNYHVGTDRPMHVGMFYDDGMHDGVIESTLPDPGCTPSYLEGVELHRYDGDSGFRRLCGAHIFVGARRPRLALTPALRQAAVRAAFDRLGKPYGIIGLNYSDRVGLIAGGISCVELVEDAWEDAGVNISWSPDALLWPHDQYWNTDPVDLVETTVARGPLVLPIVGAVHLQLMGKPGAYDTGVQPGGVPMTLEVTAQPDVFASGRARLEPSSSPQALKDLVFVPGMDDVDTTVTFSLRLKVPSTGADTRETLRVKVTSGDMCQLAPAQGVMDPTGPFIAGTVSGSTSTGGGFSLPARLVVANDVAYGPLFYLSVVDCPGGVCVSHMRDNGYVDYFARLPEPSLPMSGTLTLPVSGWTGSTPSWGFTCGDEAVSDGYNYYNIDRTEGTLTVTTDASCRITSATVTLKGHETLYGTQEVACDYAATFAPTGSR